MKTNFTVALILLQLVLFGCFIFGLWRDMVAVLLIVNGLALIANGLVRMLKDKKL